jgi:predicted RNA-binding Zn-ribbon protein involved in translation (DUF1610 family)
VIIVGEKLADGKCPRCGKEAAALGTLTIEVDKTKKKNASLKQCPSCMLLFREVSDE